MLMACTAGMFPIPGLVKSNDLTTFTYFVNFCNFWGGLLFMMSGFWGSVDLPLLCVNLFVRYCLT